jgi:hypothetical protein
MKKDNCTLFRFYDDNVGFLQTRGSKGSNTTTRSVKVIERHEPKEVSYTLENTTDWLVKNKDNNTSLQIAYAINKLMQRI